MDVFGIGAAVRGAAEIYFRSARNTGRTTHMIDNARDGDVVVFSCAREARRVERQCLDRGVKIRPAVVPPGGLPALYDRLRGVRGPRVYFDHSVIEGCYMEAIQDVDRTLTEIQNRLAQQKPETGPVAHRTADKWRV